MAMIRTMKHIFGSISFFTVLLSLLAVAGCTTPPVQQQAPQPQQPQQQQQSEAAQQQDSASAQQQAEAAQQQDSTSAQQQAEAAQQQDSTSTQQQAYSGSASSGSVAGSTRQTGSEGYTKSEAQRLAEALEQFEKSMQAATGSGNSGNRNEPIAGDTAAAESVLPAAKVTAPARPPPIAGLPARAPFLRVLLPAMGRKTELAMLLPVRVSRIRRESLLQAPAYQPEPVPAKHPTPIIIPEEFITGIPVKVLQFSDRNPVP